jgi:hypothetical protein
MRPLRQVQELNPIMLLMSLDHPVNFFIFLKLVLI